MYGIRQGALHNDSATVTDIVLTEAITLFCRFTGQTLTVMYCANIRNVQPVGSWDHKVRYMPVFMV